MIDFFVFILLSRENDGGAMQCIGQIQNRVGVFRFRIFRSSFASDFFILLLVRFHQAGIIIVVKHLIQGRNDEVWVGVEPSTFQSWMSSSQMLVRCRTLTIDFLSRETNEGTLSTTDANLPLFGEFRRFCCQKNHFRESPKSVETI